MGMEKEEGEGEDERMGEGREEKEDEEGKKKGLEDSWTKPPFSGS